MMDRCCRFCRRECAPWAHYCANNGYGLHWGICEAQALTRNHVIYYCNELGRPIAATRLPPRHAAGKDREHARAQLARCITAAEERWSHMPDTAWLDAARDVLTATSPKAPPDEHGAVRESVEASLF